MGNQLPSMSLQVGSIGLTINNPDKKPVPETVAVIQPLVGQSRNKTIRCYWCGIINPGHQAIDCPNIKSQKDPKNNNNKDLICPRPGCGTKLLISKSNPGIAYCAKINCPAYRKE